MYDNWQYKTVPSIKNVSYLLKNFELSIENPRLAKHKKNLSNIEAKNPKNTLKLLNLLLSTIYSSSN